MKPKLSGFIWCHFNYFYYFLSAIWRYKNIWSRPLHSSDKSLNFTILSKKPLKTLQKFIVILFHYLCAPEWAPNSKRITMNVFLTKNFGEYTLLRSLESRLVAPLLKNDAAYKTGRGQNISAIYHVKLAVTTLHKKSKTLSKNSKLFTFCHLKNVYAKLEINKTSLKSSPSHFPLWFKM